MPGPLAAREVNRGNPKNLKNLEVVTRIDVPAPVSLSPIPGGFLSSDGPPPMSATSSVYTSNALVTDITVLSGSTSSTYSHFPSALGAPLAAERPVLRIPGSLGSPFIRHNSTMLLEDDAALVTDSQGPSSDEWRTTEDSEPDSYPLQSITTFNSFHTATDGLSSDESRRPSRSAFESDYGSDESISTATAARARPQSDNSMLLVGSPRIVRVGGVRPLEQIHARIPETAVGTFELVDTPDASFNPLNPSTTSFTPLGASLPMPEVPLTSDRDSLEQRAQRAAERSRESFQFYDTLSFAPEVTMTTIDMEDSELGHLQLSDNDLLEDESPRRVQSIATQVLMVKNDGTTQVTPIIYTLPRKSLSQQSQRPPVPVSSSAFSVSNPAPTFTMTKPVQTFSVVDNTGMRDRYLNDGYEHPMAVVRSKRDVTPTQGSGEAAAARAGGSVEREVYYGEPAAHTLPDSEETPRLNGLDETVVSRANELSGLFYLATHGFDALSLKLELDASICLSFKRDDLCFIHLTDPSGWGEVTLVLTQERGWVPMNYFRKAIDYKYDTVENMAPDQLAATRLPLKLLFAASGKFLEAPMCIPVSVRVPGSDNTTPAMTFSTKTLNSVRDGVRSLLEETACISRSSKVVADRPTIKKVRKVLLADWFELMRKAVDFKYTTNPVKVDFLVKLLYQVIRRAVAFLEIWGIEADLGVFLPKSVEASLGAAPHRASTLSRIPYLKQPPFALARVSEIHNLLFNYLGLIIGRLDLIEHNPSGCELLENITHQIILLLRELLFINKVATKSLAHSPAELDSSLDSLLTLVSELVSGVKGLVGTTALESRTGNDLSVRPPQPTKKDRAISAYYYTKQGGSLIEVAAKMVRSVSRATLSIRLMFEVSGDRQLDGSRQYPDFYRLKIAPETFIRKCSEGLLQANEQDVIREARKANRKSMRYSLVRTGQTGALGVTADGAAMLSAYLPEVHSTPFISSDADFEPFTTTSQGKVLYSRELLLDAEGQLIGGSFRGLVFCLTNEENPPQYLLLSTVLMTFRIFGLGTELVEELVDRFDVATEADAALRSRRQLVCTVFRVWLESYWSYTADYPLLSTLVNFFNEAVSMLLPGHSSQLLELAARLAARPPVENAKDQHAPRTQLQLVERLIREMNRSQSRSQPGLEKAISRQNARYSMVDGYGLGKSKVANLIPLQVSGSLSTASSLLTPAQVVQADKHNQGFRKLLQTKWCPEKLVSNSLPLDLETMLGNWYRNCFETWLLTNYVPRLLDFNAFEVAKQLTIIESHLFCAIRPEELLNENFSPKRLHLNAAPNVARSVLFTNTLSEYVLETMLQPEVALKQRVTTMETWLKVAVLCLYLRNFNSLAAIVSSLQSFLISRLTVLWESLLEKFVDLYEYLSSIVVPDRNYNVYRSKLRVFLASSNAEGLPLVPYVSLFLQDLTFIVEGNPNHRTSPGVLTRLVNIDKYLKLGRVIADFQSLQVSYVSATALSTTGEEDLVEIAPVPVLQELILLELWKIKQLNIKEDDRGWKLSCAIEPRE